MKRLLFVCILLVFGTSLLAVNNGNDGFTPGIYTNESEPSWQILENLTLAEQENALIEIELFGEITEDAALHARSVEDIWNNGEYDRALELFIGFSDLQDAAIGIQWKEPIKTSVRWGDDVQIGSREDITVVALDVHNGTGNLFTAFHFFSGSNYYWSVNISLDTGKTWAETYQWSFTSSPMDIDGVVFGDYFYVGYTVPSSSVGRIRRCLTSDGSVDNTYGFVTVINEGVALRDIALTSSNDIGIGNIYYWAIMGNDTLRYYYSTSPTSWYSMNTGVGNADRGLDACYSVSGGHTRWASYIGTSDSLFAVSRAPWAYHGPLTYVGTSNIYVTSISGMEDTVMITHPYQVGSYRDIRYRVTYNDGTNWAQGTIHSSTSVDAYVCDITGRFGDGFGVAYQTSTASAEGFYRHRGYYSPWASPDSFADNVTRYNVKPSIERIASGVYGIVYVNFPEEYAYFDRSDWISGVDEETPEDNLVRLKGNTPNPFHNNTVISYYLPNRMRTSLKIYDVTGKLIKTLTSGERGPGMHSITWYGRTDNGSLASAGVYLYRLVAGDVTESGKMLLIK
ncbi:T9SS type A sorting domain-containing protein [candidate division WOR-3 bacterium]|nr:T9SS type A sorting domain-containing protein [candidate division WOR-3 bacterium]